MTPPRFDCIVAADRALGIGRAGALPWRLPGELRYFRELTLSQALPHAGQNAVIMGRATWDSLPPRFRPLPGRQNVVVSRSEGALAGAALAPSLDAALHASAQAPRRFVIGGAQLFQSAFVHPGCAVLHLTEIDALFGCDVFLPSLAGFERQHEGPWLNEGEVRYRFCRLERRG